MVHLRTGFQFSVQLESPGVVRTEEQSGMAAIRLAVLRRRCMALVTESLGHYVHGPMRTYAGEQANLVILVMNHNERLSKQVEVQKIARFRNLRNVRDALPSGTQ